MGSENSEVKMIIDKFLKGWCEENKEKIARLKLTGSLEDYLVKELAYQFLTYGFRVYLNMGAGRRKIDMCIISRTGKNNTYQIRALIEAKYLSNAHWDIKDSAQYGWERRYNTLVDQLEKIKEEIKKELEGIQKKIENLHQDRGMKIVWKNREVAVYGLIFVTAIIYNEKDEDFLEEIEKKVKAEWKKTEVRLSDNSQVKFMAAVCEKK